MNQEKTTTQKAKEWFSCYSNYLIIGTVSIIILLFIPFLGSAVGLGWTLPDTATGWVVFIATKIIVAVANFVIFHSFIQQAKLNSKDNPNFKEAQEIMALYEDNEIIPLSPRQFLKREYSWKGVFIFITSLLSAFALTQAILTFDVATFISYVITLIFGIISGILEMKKNEEYWCITYLSFAKYNKAQKEKENEAEAQKLPTPVCEPEVPIMLSNTMDNN